MNLRQSMFFLVFLLAVALLRQAFAFDSSQAYNVVTMSYTTNATITQNIVLNSTQQAAGSVTFSVDVKNGGGRPTQDPNTGQSLAYASQTDKAWVTIYVYNSSGGLIGSQTSQQYTLQNYGTSSNPGWSSAPGDNVFPWTNASVTYTGSLANAAYIKIEMKGTDGAFWAGNYGPEWRAPTVTVGTSTQNIVYNSEFGIAPNSVKAQGWTASSGSWAACGVTSGSLTCVTSESVTANQWGGGYDANGGTTIGQSGGYSSALSTTTADTAASTGSPAPAAANPVPTAIYNNSTNVYITNHYPTSNNSPVGEGATNAFDNNPNTKYLNFDKKNAGVTIKLNAGRIVTGFTLTTANDFSGRDPTSYKLYASNDGTNWTLLGEGSLSLSENRLWTSPMIAVTNSTAYVYYYIFFPTTKAGEGCGLDCDSMQIAEITYYYDANDTTTSSDTGTGSVANPSDYCCGGSAVPFSSNAGFTARTQTWLGAHPNGDSTVSITQIGSYNSTTVTQSGGNNGTVVTIGGDHNTTSVSQTSAPGTTINYTETSINGNHNSTTLEQTSTGGAKGIYSIIDGNSNTVTVQQKDSGSHYAEINLSGGSKNVSVTQQGSAGHMARIELSGGATQITTTQSGVTQQSYSITHNCATASCPAITVTQGQ